jgi:signal transduction histidine kinase
MTQESAILLLIAVTLATQTVLPLGAYLSLRRYPDRASLIWLVGMTFWAFAGGLTALRPWIPRYWSHEFVWLSAGFTYLCMALFFLLQLRPELRISRILWVVVPPLLILSTVSYGQDWPVHYGFVWMSVVIPAMTSLLIFLIWRIRRQTGRKSLTVMILVLAAYGLSALPRLIDFIWSGQPGRMDIFRFGWTVNLFSFMAIVGPIFLSLGHWIYTLERSNDEGRQARHLVARRDRFVLLSSDMSKHSMFSSFLGMLTHEFSNLIQTLRVSIGGLQQRLGNRSTELGVQASLVRLERSTREAEDLLASLRGLMVQTDPEGKPVALFDCLVDVASVCRSDAQARGVQMELSLEAAKETMVMADDVMLQRIVLNIVKNSFESLADALTVDAKVSIWVERRQRPGTSRECTVIEIQDNGPGYPQALLSRFGEPWVSQKPTGLGLGLLLSKNLAELWGGDIQIANRAAPMTGAITTLWLACGR